MLRPLRHGQAAGERTLHRLPRPAPRRQERAVATTARPRLLRMAAPRPRRRAGRGIRTMTELSETLIDMRNREWSQVDLLLMRRGVFRRLAVVA